jgi:hypothetical protein
LLQPLSGDRAGEYALVASWIGPAKWETCRSSEGVHAGRFDPSPRPGECPLTGLLGRTAEVRANEGLREDSPEKADHLREEAAAGTKSASAAIDKTETPIPTPPNA